MCSIDNDRALAQFSASLEENQQNMIALNNRVESAEGLAAKLENDLASVMGVTRADHLSTLDVLRSSDATSLDDVAMVPILTAQRNRLHEKVAQFEEMLRIEKTRQMSAQSEIEKIREDNGKLYEKIRFLQAGFNKQSNVRIEDGLISSSRQFSNSEKNGGLQLHDRATLNIGRAILASSKSRLIFFFYLLILHLLIMLVLYKFAFDQAALRDQETECEYKFNKHMLQNHKDH